jgi:transcriptional regulator with XRE-family HTH domain
MSVGRKIRAIRDLRGMTQKDLGIKAGFSAATADVRIRQYESNKMVPKEDKLKEIADALDIDVSALKSHDIYSDLDLMQILFEIEEIYGLEIGKDANRYILSFDEDHPLFRFINNNLDSWYLAKSKLLSYSEESGYDDKEYSLWKYRFPLDNMELENMNAAKVQEKYKPFVNNSYSIKKVNEFILLFEKLIRNGFDIQIASAPERSGIGTYVCCAIFKHSELLDATGEAANAYAEYLSMISYLEKSGIEIERETTSFDGETLLGIYFYNSVLSTALSHTVREIIKAYKDGVLDDTILQMQYKDSLRTFNVPIEK